MRRAYGLLAGAILFAGLVSPAGADDEKRAPKLSLRMANQMVSATSTKKSLSFMTVGGLEAAVVVPLSRRFAVGAGYHVDFDFGKQAIPLHGFDLFGRYYFSGKSTRIRSESRWGDAELRDGTAMYAGVFLAQRTFSPDNLSSTPKSPSSTTTADSGSGSVFAGPTFGVDLRLGPSLTLNAELSAGLFSFATSGTGYKLSTKGLSVGLCYFF